MKLVKDFIDYDIVFYWVDDNGVTISPLLHTLNFAEEWWKLFVISRYSGQERRKSIVDRRFKHHQRDRMSVYFFTSNNPLGRRYIDRPVRVDRDLSQEKILTLTACALPA